jgi:hypothetical protein
LTIKFTRCRNSHQLSAVSFQFELVRKLRRTRILIRNWIRLRAVLMVVRRRKAEVTSGRNRKKAKMKVSHTQSIQL